MVKITHYYAIVLLHTSLLQQCRAFSTVLRWNNFGQRFSCSIIQRAMIRPTRTSSAAQYSEENVFVQSAESRQSEKTNVQLHSRRTALHRLMGISLGVTTTTVHSRSIPPVHAASTKQVEEDKSKIYQGFVQLNYLLDNWEQETTICGRSGDNPYISKNGCERTPIKVMDYLGYKDISHPLFKADKTMRRLEPFVPSDREVEFYEAIESWMIAAEEGNGMAYISSWGEANPGGGKDRVQLFIERAKNDVIQARDSLSTIVDIFDLNQT